MRLAHTYNAQVCTPRGVSKQLLKLAQGSPHRGNHNYGDPTIMAVV